MKKACKRSIFWSSRAGASGSGMRIGFLSILLAAAIPLAANAQSQRIEASIIDHDGTEIGRVTIADEKAGLRISLQANGLAAGKHGVHIHGKGACDPPDFKSAGSHYSPQNRSHGFLDSKGPHAGDMPMLDIAADDRMVDYQFTSSRVSLKNDSLRDNDGSSLVIHAKADDYLTDTGGGSGDRIACAVISAGN